MLSYATGQNKDLFLKSMLDLNKIKANLSEFYYTNVAPFVNVARQHPKQAAIGAAILVLAGLANGYYFGRGYSRDQFSSGYSEGWKGGQNFVRPKSFEVTRWGNEDLEDMCANPVFEIRMNAEGRDIRLVLKGSTKDYRNPAGSGTVCVDTLVPDEPTPKAPKFGD